MLSLRIPSGICLLKVNDGITRTVFEICSKLRIKTLERPRWCRSGVFIVNFEQISHIVLMLSLLTFLYKFQLGYRLCIYIEVNESRYTALFVISGSIKKLYTIDCINIYLCPVEKCGVTPHFLYRDSLTLIKLYWSSLSVLRNVISFTFHLFLPNF